LLLTACHFWPSTPGRNPCCCRPNLRI
jgi:hypothetical protein